MPSTLTFHAPACPNPRCGQGKLICIIHLSASGSLFLFRILVTGLQVLHCRPLPLPTPSSHHYTPLLWQCCVTAHCNAVKNADIHILVHTGDDGILFWCNPPPKKKTKNGFTHARAHAQGCPAVLPAVCFHRFHRCRPRAMAILILMGESVVRLRAPGAGRFTTKIICQ